MAWFVQLDLYKLEQTIEETSDAAISREVSETM